MPGPIDDALKHLTELSPQDWVVRGGWPAATAALIDADIGTISGAADKAIRVSSTPDWLLAIDFQSGHDSLAKLPDLLLYDSALFKRHGLPVRTLLVLLHRSADSRKLTGLYERGFPGEPFDAALRYRVLRVWEVAAAAWLSGGLGLVPLAPLGSVQKADLPAVVAQMKQRFDREAPSQVKELWSAGLHPDGSSLRKCDSPVVASRSGEHERIHDVPSDTERGQSRGQSDRHSRGQGRGQGRGSPQDVAAARPRPVWRAVGEDRGAARRGDRPGPARSVGASFAAREDLGGATRCERHDTPPAGEKVDVVPSRAEYERIRDVSGHSQRGQTRGSPQRIAAARPRPVRCAVCEDRSSAFR